MKIIRKIIKIILVLILLAAAVEYLLPQYGSSLIYRVMAEKDMPEDRTSFRDTLPVQNDADELVYWEIYNGLLNYEDSIRIDSAEPEAALEIYYTVLNEHPEIFWTDSAELSSWSRGDKDLYGELRPVYAYDVQEKEKRIQQIDDYTERFGEERSRTLSGSADDYEIAKFTYEYLINNTVYNIGSEDNQNICSVFINGESVCGGYAAAYKYLLEMQGIPCAEIRGTVNDTEPHAWDLAILNGDYYYIDPTWGEMVYADQADSQPAEAAETEGLTYKYFAVNDELISKTHQADEKLILPDCTAVSCNYFVREGCLLQEYDREQLLTIVKKDIDAGRGSSEMRFADEEAMNETENELFDRLQVFELLQQAGLDYSDTVWHVSDEDFLYLRLIWEE